jgi:isoleucyl-tRNA synthetase
MIDTYGADALRLYMIYSPVVRAEDLRFSEDGVKHQMREIMIPLWNAYSFFVTYSNVDSYTGSLEDTKRSDNVLDRWIVSSMETLLDRVVTSMDAYDLQRSVRPFVHFIDDLTNWYIRRSRRRFWKSQDDEDKDQAYRTLYYVLIQLSKVAAPFIPCLSDAIYMNLRTDDMPDSVHLCDFPQADESNRDPELESQMADVMTCVRLGRLLRTENNLKVRQPLATIHVVSRNAAIRERLAGLSDLITDELNIKQAEFGEHVTELATLKAKPDFKKLGPRLGPRVKDSAKALAALDTEALEPLTAGSSVRVTLSDGEEIELSPDEIVMELVPREGVVVASEGEIVIALDTELTDALKAEGIAREFVNKVQNMRKTSGLDVSDRITIQYAGSDDVQAAIGSHIDYINSEVLSLGTGFQASGLESDDGVETWDLNGQDCAIRIRKA